MNHLNGVHKSREGVYDLLGSAVVKRVHEFLKSGQVLDVVLGLVELVCEEQIQSVVLHDKFGNFFSVAPGPHVRLLLSKEKALNSLKVPVLELLAPVCDLLHSDSPELELYFRTRVRRLLFGVAVVVQQIVDDGKPLSEFALEERHFVRICGLVAQFLLFLGVQLEELLSGGHALDGVLHLARELPHVNEILLFYLLFALAPVLGTHILDHGLVRVLDHLVQLDETLGRDLSENNLVVTALSHVDL